MCGRFVLHTPICSVAERYWGILKPVGSRNSDYNITPGQQIHSVRWGDGKPDFDLAHWGFRPQWASQNAPTPINARIEKLTSSYFREAFSVGRCVIPASGWYEWRKTGQGKQPYYITKPFQERGECLLFAGLTTPTGIGTDHRSAIITEAAGEEIAHLHDRQPVLLDPSSLPLWLDPGVGPADLKGNIKRLPASELMFWPVSSKVNRPDNNNASLIEPLADNFSPDTGSA